MEGKEVKENGLLDVFGFIYLGYSSPPPASQVSGKMSTWKGLYLITREVGIHVGA